MLKINVGGLEIPEFFLDHWRVIVNLTTDLLQLHTAAISVSRSQSQAPDILCQHVKEDAPSDIPIHALIPIIRSVEASHQPLWLSELDENNLFPGGGLVPELGAAVVLPLFWPTKQLFGVFWVVDNRRRTFSVNESLLLENYQQSIELHLANIYQQAKIQRLTQYLGKFQHAGKSQHEDYKNLTDFLYKEIDRRKVVERQLRYHKHYDSGTGFLNRFSLEINLKNRLSANCEEFGLVYIGFKNAYRLQSQIGYQAWDDVLRHYRNRINLVDEQVRILTARPNSTDLVLIVESDQLLLDLEHICDLLAEVSPAQVLQHQPVHLRSFIGVTTSVEGQTASGLMEQAFTAMLSCKESGCLYTYSSESLTKSQQHLHQLEKFLFHAVRNQNLLLYFQPKVCPETHQWQGAEALLRWQHPVLGDISNETLIHMAEKNGLIFEIGSFVLRTAIQKASEWCSFEPGFKMAINVSARQLCDVRFVEQIKQLLIEFQLPPRFLEIEVTESELITDEAVASHILQRLHALGITLSLDDFGTGYASFSYLKKYPFDCIKIDKSFIHSIGYNEKDREIARSIIQIAKNLELQVILEGIETQEQEVFAISEGCTSAQGFLYGRPMPAHQFEKILIRQQQSAHLNCQKMLSEKS